MTTFQPSRLADLRDRFKGSTLVVPTPARIHGADWVVKSVVLGVNAVVAYPKDSPGEPQMVDFGDVFLPAGALWAERGGRQKSDELSSKLYQEASRRKAQVAKTGPPDHLDLGLCACSPPKLSSDCERIAPLGLLPHPGAPNKTLKCRRSEAERIDREVRERAAAEVARKCSKCGREDGARLGKKLLIHVGQDGVCQLHGGGARVAAEPVGKQRTCPRCGEVKDLAQFSPGGSYCRPCKNAYAQAGTSPARPAEQDKALPPAAPAASSAPEPPEPAAILAGRMAEALTAPAQPAKPAAESLVAQASVDQASGFQPSFEAPKTEVPASGSLLDQIDQLIRERRQLRTENAELRARLEVADDLERQLAGIRDRVERELANV